MSLSISVTYPKRIEIEQGTPVKVMGTWTKVDHLSANIIHDARRGISFQLTPDETPQVQAYIGTLPWPELLVGEVISCSQFGEQTHLRVLPFERHLSDYKRISTAWARSAVPAFWHLLDQKTKWESSFKDANAEMWELRQQRAQPYDASQAVLAMRRYAQKQPQFRLEYCTRYLWQSVEKQLMAEHHFERLEVLCDLQKHFDASPKREVRDWLMMRVHEEALIVFEAAVATLYSSLDILGHVINEIYGFGYSDTTADFINILFDKPARIEAAEASHSLQSLYPDDPLTKFLQQEWQEWIRDLKEWRNYIIHHGCVEGGMWVMLVTDAESFMPNAKLEGEAREFIKTWTEQLRVLLEHVAGIVSEHLDQMSEALPPVNEATPTSRPKPDQSQAVEVMQSFLELWKMNTAQDPKRLSFMYSRLTKTSQRDWPFLKFCRYIEKHPLVNWEFVDGVSRSSGSSGGEQYGFFAVMEFAEGKLLWPFVLSLDAKSNLAINLSLPLTVPPTFTRRTRLLQFGRHQSDHETGYRDMVFSVTITNTSQDVIESVTLYIFWMEISGANVEIGTLLSGETRTLTTSWKDAFMTVGRDTPPISNVLIGEITARIIYRLNTDEGSWWSESITLPSGDIKDL